MHTSFHSLHFAPDFVCALWKQYAIRDPCFPPRLEVMPNGLFFFGVVFFVSRFRLYDQARCADFNRRCRDILRRGGGAYCATGKGERYMQKACAKRKKTATLNVPHLGFQARPTSGHIFFYSSSASSRDVVVAGVCHWSGGSGERSGERDRLCLPRRRLL